MESEFEATIGLEVHAELHTETKMFCDSKNDPDETRPNRNVCPVCMAHPGTLPVINREAVKKVLKVGIALGSKLADYTEFDRKNYFYPDLPKGYQLSQFAYPLVSGGSLNGVEITRVHLEEDTASSVHDEATGATTIDYNRAGIPLMELVTEPVMHTAQEAGDFGRELQLLLRSLGVSEANMEKGQMRVEANVSVARRGQRSAAYVEIKNLNSFRAMERAVAYEIRRQQGMLERGEAVTKQTLGWDENKQATFPQRLKEGSADYRYFPDPDLPSLRISEIRELSPEELKKDISELPAAKRARYLGYGIQKEDADLYVRNESVGAFFEEVTKGSADSRFVKLASNYIANDLMKIIRDRENRDSNLDDEMPLSALHMKSIITMIVGGSITSRAAKDLLALVVTEKRDPEALAAERGLFQNNSSADLNAAIDSILAAHPAVVTDYRGGKEAALQFLVGQGMKALKGAADPVTLREAIKARVASA